VEGPSWRSSQRSFHQLTHLDVLVVVCLPCSFARDTLAWLASIPGFLVVLGVQGFELQLSLTFSVLQLLSLGVGVVLELGAPLLTRGFELLRAPPLGEGQFLLGLHLRHLHLLLRLAPLTPDFALSAVSTNGV
jgi:hypothetical protein